MEHAEAGSAKNRVVEIRLPYITNKSQALKEAKFRAREQYFRRKTVSFITKMPPQALLYGSCHLIEYPLINKTVSQGHVVSYDKNTRVLEISEAVFFEEGKQYVIRLTDKKGVVTSPIPITSSSFNDANIFLNFEDTSLKLLGDYLKKLSLKIQELEFPLLMWLMKVQKENKCF